MTGFTYFRQTALQTLSLLLLSLALGVATYAFHPGKPLYDPAMANAGITFDTLAQRGLDVLWVDARSEAEYAEDHIPGALLLNLDNWEEQFETFVATWMPGQTVVVYCGSAGCSDSKAVAIRLKEAAGLEDIYTLEGGWDAWLELKARLE